MDKPYVQGTCDGTGAAIHVCLGFIPSKVEIYNVEDAGTLLPVATWLSQMAFTSALDEGFVETGISDTDFDRTVMASGGISAYAGGDTIIYARATSRWNKADASTIAEEVYVDGAYELLHASNPGYRCFGDAVMGKPRYDAANALMGGDEPVNGAVVHTTEGFVIGTNANLNADGERLVWIAWR